MAKLGIDLLLKGEETSSATTTLTLSPILLWVAEADNVVVAHVSISPVTLSEHADWRGYALAPLAVTPEHQKSGIGTELVQRGLQHLSEMGVHMVFVYGDPEYYGRFGFVAETAVPYVPPYALEFPSAWQGQILHKS